jgi:hypothetical protein
MTNDAFEYDVAVSFAREDKAAAEKLAKLLIDRHQKVFLDAYTPTDTWGNDVADHLVNLYARKARYCLLLISRHHPLKSWTEEDRTSVSQLALRDAEAYILPLQLDETEVPGVADVKGYRDLRQDSMESIVNLLKEKLNETKTRSGPPSRSHDLRSGNVPDDGT